VYTNDSGIQDLVAMDGGHTCAATSGGVVCYGTGEQIKFTTADGLADNWVCAIAVDGAGRLWFGTDGGVSVLDHGGTPFEKSDDAWATLTTADGLADNDVCAIAVDGAGRLWFGTYYGVSVLDHGGTPFDKGDDAWATFTTADGLAAAAVRAIAVDGAGHLWFGTGGGVSVLDHGGTPFDEADDAWVTFTTYDGLAEDYIGAIAVDGAGRLWFGGGGVSVLDHGGTPFDKADDTWATFTTADGLAEAYVYAIAVDGAGRLWVGAFVAACVGACVPTNGWYCWTEGGASVLDHGGTPFDKSDDTWATFTTADGLADNGVEAIAVDGAGRLWFGTVGGGVSVLDHRGTPFDKGDDTWATLTTADGLAGNNVHDIAVDGAGRLWATVYGFNFGGVSVLDDGGTPFDETDDAWATFTTADGLYENYIGAIAVDGAGRLWVGAYGSMWGWVSVLDHGGTPFDKGDDTWATFTADYSLSSRIAAIAVDGAGRLWFGGGGVSVLDHGGTPFDEGDDAWATFTTADGPVDNAVHAIAVDGTGRLWFGMYGGGVSVLDHGGTPFDKSDDTWAAFTTADDLASNDVEAIAVDGEGRLWFGTVGGGVSVLDHGGTPFDKDDDVWATFTTADGLADNDVRAIVVHGAGRLWFGTYGGGVSVLNHGGTPFDEADDTWATFTTADGLADNDVETIAVDGRGHLWFGTDGGVAELVRYHVHLPAIRRPWDAYYEGNDRWRNAYGPLACGQAYQAYPDDMDDWYYFRLAEGSTVSVSVEDFAPISTYGDLLLYGPLTGGELGADPVAQYGLSGSSSMSLGPLPLEPGKYYVRVRTAQHHSTTQLYRLTVHWQPCP
jgi:ligand-binding sensor domain-containing protein